MQKFIFGKLVEAENICNLDEEKKQILKNINHGNNVVIYGRRNTGKTSLVKNIIIKQFLKKNKNTFVYFVDLFNVKTSPSLVFRLKAALEHSMIQMPIKKWTGDLKSFIANLRPIFSLDPITGATNINLEALDYQKTQSIYDIFNLLKEINKKKKLLIIFDEFQDIAGLKSELGIIRGELQQIDAPAIIMGSKNHLLREIFSKPKEPFYQWGNIVEFKAIDYKTYQQYINERFEKNKLNIEYEEARILQDNMRRVPEAINIICYEIMETHSNKKIELNDINSVILSLLETRQSQYEELLRYLSLNEQIILASIAKKGGIEKYNSKEYLADIKMNNKTVSNIFKKLLNEGQIEIYQGIYRVNDPLLELFLIHYW